MNRFEYPRVFQGGKKESPTPGKHVRLLPIRLAFWPLDPLVGVLTKEDLVLTNEPAIVDGREHTVVRSRGGADAAEIWLDPERDFVPVRYSLLWDDAVVISVSLDYKSMDGHWVPQSWKITMLDSSGAIRRSYSESVTKCHVNGTLDDAEFSIRPEPGAWVTDSSNDEVYIVRQDGSKRIVGPTEYTGSNYRELLNSDPKDAEGGKFVLWAASAVAVAVFSFLLWIRQRRLRQLGRSRDN
jgi:hypothetical protein